MNDESLTKKWLSRLGKAEKNYKEYHKLIEDIRKYYRNETRKDKLNIFWSSIETLKPFLYFKQPKPFVERKEKTADKVQNLACRIVEKALIWDLEQFDFDSIIKYARNDFLLAGFGLVIERYKPKFVSISGNDGEIVEVKADEQVDSEYVDPTKFIADSDKVSVWEDCTWFAIKQYMTKDEVIEAFGNEVLSSLAAEETSDVENEKNIDVYEVWDKTEAKVLYISRKAKKILKQTDNPLGLDGVVPFPKPVFATLTNDGIIPVPDYIQIKPLLDELDGVTSRMEKTMKALKVSGCYDNAFPELASILNKDVTLVSISDFDRLKSAGGIKNIIDFMPVAQYIETLQALAQRRQDIMASVYEITGVSDIMRGNSDPNETATAVAKKTNFGTLRNQDRQNDMQRFITDLFKIKAEIICEQFSNQKLQSFLPADEQDAPEAIKAVELLKTDKLRNMLLGIESDTTFTDENSAAKTMEAVKTIDDMISKSFNILTQQPALLPLYQQMTASVIASTPSARQYDAVIEQCFDKIAADLNQPRQSEPNPQMLALQNQSRKTDFDYQIKKELNEIKKAELAQKQATEQAKLALTKEEMELQAGLKQAQIAVGETVDANIPTGFVKAF